jgi:elongation factor Ts
MLRKFYEESVLLEQKFIKDDSITIGDMVRAYSGKTGATVDVRRFARFELGGA